MDARPGKGDDRKSRLEIALEAEVAGEPRTELLMPHLDAGEHVVEYFFDVGPTVGGEPITYLEIGAWAEMSGAQPTPWECQVLRRMSVAYAAQHHASRDLKALSPFTAPLAAKPNREELAARILAAFRGMAAPGSTGDED